MIRFHVGCVCGYVEGLARVGFAREAVGSEMDAISELAACCALAMCAHQQENQTAGARNRVNRITPYRPFLLEQTFPLLRNTNPIAYLQVYSHFDRGMPLSCLCANEQNAHTCLAPPDFHERELSPDLVFEYGRSVQP